MAHPRRLTISSTVLAIAGAGSRWVYPRASALNNAGYLLNEDVIENPQLINQDPYGKGWLFRVRPHKGEEQQPAELLDAKEYTKVVASEAH